MTAGLQGPQRSSSADALEGRHLGSRGEVLVPRTGGEVKTEACGGTKDPQSPVRGCAGGRRGGRGAGPGQGLLETLAAPPWCLVSSGLGETRPRTRLTDLFIPPASVTVCSEDLRAGRGRPPQDCFPRSGWDLRPEQAGTRPRPTSGSLWALVYLPSWAYFSESHPNLHPQNLEPRTMERLFHFSKLCTPPHPAGLSTHFQINLA